MSLTPQHDDAVSSGNTELPFSGDARTPAKASNTSSSLYSWGHGTHKLSPQTTCSKPPVQKSRTKQPPTTLMVPTLTKFEQTHEAVGPAVATGAKPKDRSVTGATASKLKQQRTQRKSRTSESDSSKTSSHDGSGGRGKDISSEDGSVDSSKRSQLTPKRGQTRQRKDRSDDSSRKTTPKTPRKSPKPFEPYISLEELQRGLKKGELIEGILRINPKNYEDAYISAPDGEMDIYIGGILDRNRTLNGDIVVVQIKPQHEWKVLWENMKVYDLKNPLPPAPHQVNNDFYVSPPDPAEVAGIGYQSSKKSKRGKRGKKKKDQTCTSSTTATSEKCEQDNCEGNVKIVNEIAEEHKEEEETSVAKDCELVKKRKNRQKKKNKKNDGSNNEVTFESPELSESPAALAAAKSDLTCQEASVEPNELDSEIEEIDDPCKPASGCCNSDSGCDGVAVPLEELSDVDERSLDGGSICSDHLDIAVEMMDILNLDDSTVAENKNITVGMGWGETGESLPPITNWVPSADPFVDSVSMSKMKDGKMAPSAEVTLSGDDSQLLMRKQISVAEALKHPFAYKFVQKTAKVVYLKERKHNLVAVGHLKLMQDRNPHWALFSPQDHRLPRMMIPIPTCPSGFAACPEDFAKILFIARLTEWENTGFAKGHLYRSLGEAGLVATETEAILISNNVDYSEFPDDLLENIPEKLPWIVPDSELRYRRDLRRECIFTIDPSTARDLDDAMSCRELPDGTFEIGVHIADVSFFVQEGSKVDQIAASRGTSVYLVQTVVPMLPRILCEQLCSLNPGEDRLTMSVIWKVTPIGDILEEWFGRTVIKSCAKLSYEQAQRMIDEPQHEWKAGEHPQMHGDHETADVGLRVRQLHQIALILRKQRFESGALSLNQVRLQFSLDSETGMPSGFSVYEQKDSNRLIEEFMLLANMAVSHRILKSFPDKAVLRCHPPPQRHMMDEIFETFLTAGIALDTSSAGKIQESLIKLRRDDGPASQARQLVLISLLSKPMQRALYFCAGCCNDEALYHHYALNVPLYTHFTSPIRRYADILVHRLLAASMNYGEEPHADKKWIQRQCEHCNDKKYAAKIAQELSQDLFLGAFIKEGGSRTEVGMVVAVLDHSFDVLILQFGITKRVYCNQLPLLSKVYQRQQGIPHLTLTWQADDNHPVMAQTVTLFTLVNVMMIPTNEPFKFNAVMKRPQESPTLFPSNFTVPKI